jgi:GDP-mannose 6-dehydrogenase
MAEKYDVCMVGLGPVGTVSGLCFAKQNFRVIGVDIDEKRINAFAYGKAPFSEPGLEELLKEARKNNLFQATLDMEEGALNSPVIMIAVGTPTPTNEPDLSQLDKACERIGKILKYKDTPTVIAIRSTIPPGTIRNRLTPIIEGISGKRAGMDFHMASNPEFLREGMAIHDFFHTSRIIIGTDSDYAAETIEVLYAGVESDIRLRVNIESAEFAKYVDNTWHALKVSFSNEIGRICQATGGRIEEMTRIFLSDKRLNLSEIYLKPGFAFGGSCLPKDVRALSYIADSKNIDTPVIDAILPSNEAHIAMGIGSILGHCPKHVGLLGVAFKENVDDLRESPALAVAGALIKYGIDVKAHDPCYPAGQALPVPGLRERLEIVSLEKIVAASDMLVMMHRIPLYHIMAEQFRSEDKPVIDLTRLPELPGADIAPHESMMQARMA